MREFGHKAIECRSKVSLISRVMINMFNEGIRNQFFNGYCYACNKFRHRENLCRSRNNGGQSNHKVVICYNCNKPRHMSTVCKNNKGKKFASEEKSEPVKKIDKEEMKQEMEKTWKKKRNLKLLMYLYPHLVQMTYLKFRPNMVIGEHNYHKNPLE